MHVIDRYLDDSTSEYAVMLTGDWGTDKTHFVKNELANKLANRADKTAVIRVSLMRTSSADEVYGRIVQAAFASNVPLPENYENSAGAKAAKAALNTVVGFAAKKLEDAGLSYQLPADACASIMLPKNCLIVLDDLERCPHLAYHDLYGLMSSLVEGQGRKALLVCNDKEPGYLEKDAEDASAKAALEEKLVWARYRFEPDADDIVSSVMAQSFNGLRWKDEAFEATVHALRQAGGNIQSLKKTRKLIDEALNTRFLEDETVDKSRKARTLGTIALLSLRCASGKPPVWEHNA